MHEAADNLLNRIAHHKHATQPKQFQSIAFLYFYNPLFRNVTQQAFVHPFQQNIPESARNALSRGARQFARSNFGLEFDALTRDAFAVRRSVD